MNCFEDFVCLFCSRTETLQCPSDNVIVTNYKCPMNGKWVDCERKHCCKDYTYVAGR